MRSEYGCSFNYTLSNLPFQPYNLNQKEIAQLFLKIYEINIIVSHGQGYILAQHNIVGGQYPTQRA